MKYEMLELNDFQISALREIVNIGVGNAVTSLSKMIGKEIRIEVPRLNVELIEKVPDISGGADAIVSGVIMHVTGDVEGYIIMMLSEETTINICKTINGSKNTDIMDPLNQSLIEELGNILAGSYVSSLSDFLMLNVKTSPPMQTFDMLGAIIDHILIEMSQKAESALLFDTSFMIEGTRMDGMFLTLLDPSSMEVILERIDQMV